MHTIINHGISPEKISLIQTIDGSTDALSIVKSIYQRYDNKEEFRILNSFMEYCEKKKTS